MRKPGHFEQSLVALETIVLELEKGELMLEDALKQFEKGMALAHTCQDTLRKAEQKIELLSSQNLIHDESLDD